MANAATKVGLLHPGEMGAAVGAALRGRGIDVLWASSGRSAATAERARRASLTDVDSVEYVVRESDVVVSVCPPHAALEVAGTVRGFDGVYVDANAVSPGTAREIAATVEDAGARYVDGGIVGPPPAPGRPTTLYLSGGLGTTVADLFAGTPVQARVISAEPGAASAVKMAYAAWTKGTAALLLAIRALAQTEDVEAALLDEWADSIPELPDDSLRSARAAARKGWRWVGEMEEIASTFASAGLPDGFHLAAAEVFRRSPRREDAQADEQMLADVLDALRGVRTAGARAAGRPPA
jgi:3-hydroxyisobutyrate dehydrogenase-like beta-hydroxyacid dehydrogenase